MTRAAMLLSLGIALAAGIDRAVMAQPADLPSDTTIIMDDDGDTCPADPTPLETSAGVEV